MAATKANSIVMTEGRPLPQIIRFSVPLALTGILQLLFNAADVIVVGKFDSSTALAAVGATTSLINLLIGAFIGISVGVNILVARYLGCRDDERVSRSVHTSVVLGLGLGVVVFLLGFFLASPLLRLMDTPEDVLPLSDRYLQIYFIGVPASLLYNFCAAVLRAFGDTKKPFFFLSISGTVNVLLNLFFVIVCRLGVAGVAIATVVSQYLALALVLICLMRLEGCAQLELKKLRFYPDEALRMIQIGLPAGLQSVIFNISNVMIQSSINSFGADVVAANTAAGNLDSFIYTACNSVYHASMTFTSQNLGAGKYDRIRQGTYACLFIGILYCVLYILIAQFGTRYLSLLFMNADEAASVMSYTQQLNVAYAYATPLLLGVNVLRLSIQGMGYSRLSLISGLLEMLARTAVSLWAVPAFGFDAACLASPLAWLLADCFLVPGFYGCLNARRRQAARVRKELPEE
jgi:putative MATE family efflux protein